jgi:tight adherence protein C
MKDQSTLIVIAFAVAVGVTFMLLAWLVSRAIASVPDEDRQYKDIPPIGFRLVWVPIHWLSFFIQPFISKRYQERLLAKLRKGGLDYCLSPAQFVASRIICALIVGLLFWWVLGSFDKQRASGSGFTTGVYSQAIIFGLLFGYFYPGIWLRDRLDSRKRELLKTLPFFLDIITLCVEAGLNLQGAIHQAVEKGPIGVLRSEFQRVLRDIRAGKPRAESLRDFADRLEEPSISNFTAAVIQAENMGMNIGPVLRAQADQRRSERFLRAEKLAMEAPVKMLFPLLAFIFPCTFIVLFFPIVMKFMNSGL